MLTRTLRQDFGVFVGAASRSSSQHGSALPSLPHTAVSIPALSHDEARAFSRYLHATGVQEYCAGTPPPSPLSLLLCLAIVTRESAAALSDRMFQRMYALTGGRPREFELACRLCLLDGAVPTA